MKKLKIGLLIEEYEIPSWAYEMIEVIKESKHSEITLIVIKKKQINRDRLSFSEIWKKRNELMFLLYSKLDAKIFTPTPDAFELKNLKTIIDCPEIEIKSRDSKFNDLILDEDLIEIKKSKIDVFIKLGFRILNDKIFTCSKYGIWSYYHGDYMRKRGGPSGVWEILEQCTQTGVILQILTKYEDSGIIIYDSFSSTDSLSIKRNKNNYYWKAKSFIPRKLRELNQVGEEQFLLRYKKKNTEPHFYSNRLYTVPRNFEVLRALIIIILRFVIKKINRVFILEQWILLFKFEKKEGVSQSFYKFNRILPPKDRFWADPFVLEKDNKYYIFIEELVYKENKGKICVIEMDENGNYQEPVVALEKDYHLSYPFLIEDSGELYMIPETSENNTIELYKCENFPIKWKLFKVLINNVVAVDSTIFRYNDKFWLFTNIRENSGASKHDELFLFYSDNLLNGKWIPHPQNPIISDVKCARPGGNIFIFKDRIFRPAQNCAKHYGHGMQIREIVKLSESAYEERQIQSIYPDWEKGIISTHTLNFTGRLTVIDALIKRRKYFKNYFQCL